MDCDKVFHFILRQHFDKSFKQINEYIPRFAQIGIIFWIDTVSVNYQTFNKWTNSSIFGRSHMEL